MFSDEEDVTSLTPLTDSNLYSIFFVIVSSISIGDKPAETTWMDIILLSISGKNVDLKLFKPTIPKTNIRNINKLAVIGYLIK